MENTSQDAIRKLQAAAGEVARSGEPGSKMKLDTLHNAVHYLLTGNIAGSRGVANLWANWPVGK